MFAREKLVTVQNFLFEHFLFVLLDVNAYFHFFDFVL